MVIDRITCLNAAKSICIAVARKYLLLVFLILSRLFMVVSCFSLISSKYVLKISGMVKIRCFIGVAIVRAKQIMIIRYLVVCGKEIESIRLWQTCN